MATDPTELAHRYAVALDRKDHDALAALFVPAIQAAVRARLQPAVDRLGVTVLSVTTQVMDPVDDDHATGVVYCTAEVEDPDHGWIRQSIVYQDRYERVDGQWYFRARDHQLVYGEQQPSNPIEQTRANWPESQVGRGTYPPPWPLIRFRGGRWRCAGALPWSVDHGMPGRRPSCRAVIGTPAGSGCHRARRRRRRPGPAAPGRVCGVQATPDRGHSGEAQWHSGPPCRSSTAPGCSPDTTSPCSSVATFSLSHPVRLPQWPTRPNPRRNGPHPDQAGSCQTRIVKFSPHDANDIDDDG